MLALKGNNQYPGEKWQLLLVELSAVNLIDVMPLKRIASTNLLLFLWLPFYSIIQSIHQNGNLHFPWYNYFKATFNYFASILPFVFPWQWCPIENLWFKYHNWLKGKCTVQLIIIVKYSESGVISSGIFGLYDPKHIKLWSNEIPVLFLYATNEKRPHFLKCSRIQSREMVFLLNLDMYWFSVCQLCSKLSLIKNTIQWHQLWWWC